MTNTNQIDLSANSYATPDTIVGPASVGMDAAPGPSRHVVNQKALDAQAALMTWSIEGPLERDDGYVNPTPQAINGARRALQHYLTALWSRSFPFELNSVAPDGDGGVIIECFGQDRQTALVQYIYDDGTGSVELFDPKGKLIFNIDQ